MLATLKDKATNSIQEKEFVEDLYFLKREGNASVHGSSVKKDAILALECLQRAFEIAINYSVHYKKSNSKLLKLQYSTELLITGKQKKTSLAKKYDEEKKKNTTIKNNRKKLNKIKSTPPKKFSFFWIFVLFAAIVSTILILTIFLLSFVS